MLSLFWVLWFYFDFCSHIWGHASIFFHVGRGNASWLTPLGSAAITMHLNIDRRSTEVVTKLLKTVPALAVADAFQELVRTQVMK